MFTQSYMYELPFGKGKPWLQDGPGRWILGDWQVQGIFSAIKGEPFTVSESGSTLNSPNNSQRADVVGMPRIIGDIAGTTGSTLFFTTDAFAMPAPNADEPEPKGTREWL